MDEPQDRASFRTDLIRRSLQGISTEELINWGVPPNLAGRAGAAHAKVAMYGNLELSLDEEQDIDDAGRIADSSMYPSLSTWTPEQLRRDIRICEDNGDYDTAASIQRLLEDLKSNPDADLPEDYPDEERD